MRVGIIIYGLDRPLTGIGRYTLELVRALADSKPCAEITLLCAGGIGPLSDLHDYREVSLAGSRLLPALMTWGQISLWQRARQLDLDMIHDPTGVSPVGFAKHQSATVTTIHDVFAWSLPGYSSWVDTFLYKQWLTRRSARTNAIITISSQSRADILKYLKPEPESLSVIPYGVSPKFRPLGANEYESVIRDQFGIARPYILYVGALTERKNLGRLLHAFVRVRNKYPDFLLVLAGPRSWKQSPIESIVTELNLCEHVRLTGPVTDSELPALYNGASLFAFPSLYEGFGLPVLEAMACGTPVLTSDVSSLPEVVGNAGVMVDPYNIEEMAQEICHIIGDQCVSQQLRERGLERASLFSWENVARKTMNVYDRVGGS
jgi:glycosyltransferase involved in cell wall biosynthesis